MMGNSWHRRGCSCVVIAFGLLFLVAPPASPQSITVVKEINTGSCYLDTSNPGTNYIVAELLSLPSIAGAEFSVSGLPPGASVVVTPNPAAIAMGDPFGDGCTITFSDCAPATSATVLLYTVTILAPPGQSPVYTLQVTGHHTPSNPTIDGPVVYLCNSPFFTAVSVRGYSSTTGPYLAVPSDPQPRDAALNVSREPQLDWGYTGVSVCCGIGTAYVNVYFGTTSDPPLVCLALEDCQPFSPGLLEPETTYYWRVVASPDQDCGDRSGPVWSFTTGRTTVPVLSTNWDVVKRLYRE